MKAIKNLLGGLLLVIVLIIMDREIGQEKPVKNRTNRKLWFAICLLLGFVATCFGGVMTAQEVQVFYASLGQGMLGQVVCNKNEAVAILVNSNYNMDSTQLRRVVEHEMVHVGQLRANGGCIKASLVYQRDPMAMEIPAYCAELKERMASGNPLGVLTDFIMHLKGIYGQGMTIDQVTEKVYKHCDVGGSNDSS